MNVPSGVFYAENSTEGLMMASTATEFYPLTRQKLVPEIKERWLTALRSGKYKQGAGALRVGDKYCCLGVLCQLLAEEAYIPVSSSGVTGEDGGIVVYDGTTTLPSSLTVAIAFGANVVRAGGENWNVYDPRSPSHYMTSLAQLNDSGMSFAEIADVIEEQF